MTAEALVDRWTRPARRRALADDVLVGTPFALPLAALAWRLHHPAVAVGIALAMLVGLALLAERRARRFDRGWLVRRLDADRADLEDSAGLLFADAPATGPLQQLQRERLRKRLGGDGAAVGLRPAWSTRRIVAAWLVGLLTAAAIVAWPEGSRTFTSLAPGREGGPVRPGAPRLVGQRLHVAPPAYTGIAAYDLPSLDAKVPQGSRLQWTLRFAPQAPAVDFAFPDGARLPLARAGGDWSASVLLDRSRLYRVSPQGGSSVPAPPLHRLDVVLDAPPRIEVIAPGRTLTLVTPGQKTWSLLFEASDDYGVAPTAQLHLTFAQGEGENVAFRERTLTIAGEGGPRRRRFAPRLDLAALGFAAGGDLVAQLIVTDNRTPAPQVVRSPSLILRWPSKTGAEGEGLDGAVKTELPAYLRSQRQVIIDAEALIKQRPKPDAPHFIKASNGIGDDQHGLRQRYGHFLGEEAEGGANALPTNDDPGAPAAPPKAGFGGGGDDVLESYGHVHDQPEAATLLDPKTRATLKQALDQMWQSELHLRQGDPSGALPYAYKALGFIKEVQQASRIFLARVGPELPPIDETRRLTGDRAGLERRDLTPPPAEAADAVPVGAWKALQDTPGAPAAALQLDALDRWLHVGEAQVPDPLALEAALDAVRREPGCASCRRTLRGLLWSALSRPPPGVARRGQADAAGRRYLDALAAGGAR